MSVKLLTEYHFEFLGLKGGCTGWYESTFVKMPHCWTSHATAQLFVVIPSIHGIIRWRKGSSFSRFKEWQNTLEDLRKKKEDAAPPPPKKETASERKKRKEAERRK